MRTEPCACGALLRFPLDDRAWPALMGAHVRTERHALWRIRTLTHDAHVYEEHLTRLLEQRRPVARSGRARAAVSLRRVA